MATIFSYIVQKRLSQESENVATTALEFILKSEAATSGMMKLLHSVTPELPRRLWFRTQQTEGSNRPDMWGNDDQGKAHVFVENKFWAGLTENQPVSYLRILADHTYPTVLLVVVPEVRHQSVWRELNRKLAEAEISSVSQEPSVGIINSIKTSIGPTLAITSWTKLLSFLEIEIADDDRAARSDLYQLRALCDAEESNAFAPITSEEISDQRTPALILQLSTIWEGAVELAVSDGILNLKGTTQQASTERIGRYAYFGNQRYAGLWLGIYFPLWQLHGGTPLWIYFTGTDWGHSTEVRNLIEPWASKKGVFTTEYKNGFAVAIDIPFGEEKEVVVRAIAARLRDISEILSVLKTRSSSHIDLKAAESMEEST